jgi:hypothetical protein
VRKAGIIRSFFAVATAITAALTLISLLEPLMSFEAASAPQQEIISTPGAKWTEAMENLPTPAYLWLLLVYAVGSLSAGIVCYVISPRESLLQIVSVLLSLLMLINLNYTPNPVWFWFLAVAAIGLPVYTPVVISRFQKIKA